MKLITTKLGIPIKIQLEVQGAATQPSYIQLDFGPQYPKAILIYYQLCQDSIFDTKNALIKNHISTSSIF